MKLYNLLAEIETVFENAVKNSSTEEALSPVLEKLMKQCGNTSLLVRERFTLSTVLEYNINKLHRSLHLAYVYDGTMYSTAKVHRQDDSTVMSTDVLHKMGLLSDVWDRMGQVWIYSTGAVYCIDKEEDRTVLDAGKKVLQ